MASPTNSDPKSRYLFQIAVGEHIRGKEGALSSEEADIVDEICGLVEAGGYMGDYRADLVFRVRVAYPDRQPREAWEQFKLTHNINGISPASSDDGTPAPEK